MYTCVYFRRHMLTLGHVRVHTPPFYLPTLHTILCITKRRSVTQLSSRLRLNMGHFSATGVSPTAFSRCLFGPSLLFFSVPCSLRYCLHTGISRVSSLHCFICMQLVYQDTGIRFSWDAYDHASYAVVATCGSHAGDRCCLFQLCVICRRNTQMSTWRQEYWPLHARCQ